LLQNIFIIGKEKHSQRAKLNKWEFVFEFNIQPRKFNDFDKMCAFHQDSEKSFLKHNAISCVQTKEGMLIMWGMNFCKKKYIDPLTEEVVSAGKAETEEEFKDILKVEMGMKITFPLFMKTRDYTGFTEEQAQQKSQREVHEAIV